MEPATRNTLDVYVREGNRKALKNLLAQRKRVIAGLNALALNYDTSNPLVQCEEEIVLIEAALAKLKKIAAPRPSRLRKTGDDGENQVRAEISSARGFGPALFFLRADQVSEDDKCAGGNEGRQADRE
jgi:hypothetical protein